MPYNHKLTGSLGENLVLDFLLEQNYRLVDRNFRLSFGELDLVMLDPVGCLAIIEVKTDAAGSAGTPESWVTGKKIHQIHRLAKSYLALNPPPTENIRFDVVSVTLTGSRPKIKHIKNAFLPAELGY